MQKIPLAVTGAALIGAAILLSWLPHLYGPGLIWSLLALALGLVFVQQHLRLPQVSLPASLDRPWVGPLFTVVAVVLTWTILRPQLVSLLWLAGSACLVYDQWQRPATDPYGFRSWFDWRPAWTGYRRLMLVGLAVMFIAMLFTFRKGRAGIFLGGYDYGYSGTTWNYLKYLTPGTISAEGRDLGFATMLQFIMAGMALWVGYPLKAESPVWLRNLPLIGGAIAALWWLGSPKEGLGSLLFLVGLVAAGAAAVFLSRGEASGKWDGSPWLDKVPWLRNNADRSPGNGEN